MHKEATMGKGCLTGILVFLSICFLFGMCSSDSDDSATESTATLSIVDDSTLEYSTLEITADSTDETVTETSHVHEYSAATCTTPPTCSCGATNGEANGHSWTSATCSEPKTCSDCGATSGLAAGHNFSNGECTMCGKTDPNYISETMVWIPTKGGTKYHRYAGCSNMDNPSQVTKSQAESRGFSPCKKCY